MPAQPNLRYALGSTVAPGDRICSARKCGAGDGVYVRGGNIYASSVGKLNLVASGDTYAVTVVLDGGKQRGSSQVLSVGQVVLGRVVRVITQQAFVEIVSADVTGPLKEKHSGSIRKEDVRAGATEEVGIILLYLNILRIIGIFVLHANSKGGSSGKAKTEKKYCSFSILSFLFFCHLLKTSAKNIC